MTSSKASNERGIEWARGNPDRRCVATSRAGVQCRNWAIRGGAVCRYHGGSTKRVKAKARERIELAQDLVAMRMIGFAIDEGVPPHVAVAAARDILDRGGITAKQAVELSAAKEPEPWEQMFSGIAKITRAEHEAKMARLRGEVVDAPEPTKVVDAELVPPQEPHACRPTAEVEAAEHPDPPDGAGGESATSTARVTPPPRLLTQEEAAALMRESRLRNSAVPRKGRKRHVRRMR
jgi:hypothetical protein